MLDTSDETRDGVNGADVGTIREGGLLADADVDVDTGKTGSGWP